MTSAIPNQLISFLQQELEVPETSIKLAQARGEETNFLPIILWQYGLLNLEQLERVFDWLETQKPNSDFQSQLEDVLKNAAIASAKPVKEL